MVGLATSRATVPEASSGAGRPTILVVDDEPDIRNAVKGVLEATLGVHVLVASSAAEALDILERAPHVDLIITDFKMPGMNGLEFLRRALADHPKIPAVLITAFERELVDATDAMTLARTVLTKPLNPRPMVQTVQQLLAEAEHA
jgi:CheY-like chemotaxis protein